MVDLGAVDFGVAGVLVADSVVEVIEAVIREEVLHLVGQVPGEP